MHRRTLARSITLHFKFKMICKLSWRLHFCCVSTFVCVFVWQHVRDHNWASHHIYHTYHVWSLEVCVFHTVNKVRSGISAVKMLNVGVALCHVSLTTDWETKTDAVVCVAAGLQNAFNLLWPSRCYTQLRSFRCSVTLRLKTVFSIWVSIAHGRFCGVCLYFLPKKLEVMQSCMKWDSCGSEAS